MMDRETALSTLRLSTDATHADILTAFSRLARRYPLQQFPKRHTSLLEAKSVLLNPELAFRNVLFDEHIDLGWLNRYSKKDESNKSITSADQDPIQFCMEAIFRPHLKQGSLLFPINTPLEKNLSRLLDEIGPDNLRELIESFGLE